MSSFTTKVAVTCAIAMAAIVPMTTSASGFSQDANDKPAISKEPPTAEQLAIYHSLLLGWNKDQNLSINLSELTRPPDDSYDSCIKSLSMEPPSKLVHRFRTEDASALGLGYVHLVDPDAHTKVVQENDPWDAIRSGTSVDEAVENGFRHGLFSLGEIRFDRTHTHAIVSYSFVCGGLCGHGATVVMAQKKGGWVTAKTCGNWMS